MPRSRFVETFFDELLSAFGSHDPSFDPCVRVKDAGGTVHSTSPGYAFPFGDALQSGRPVFAVCGAYGKAIPFDKDVRMTCGDCGGWILVAFYRSLGKPAPWGDVVAPWDD